ncbi:MAG TPA: hypothetical protein VJN69_04165 [Candidatus Acidoferrales bacterium]|nr:hypothetical protein [Candidatus Acidoferrales bacterium]
MAQMSRTSLLVRCSQLDAQTVHAEALTQHRSVSGYLLNVLERSMWIEQRFLSGLTYVMKIAVPASLEARTAIHLRCTAEEADRIREAAEKREASISNFVVFSLHRQWNAAERVRNS